MKKFRVRVFYKNGVFDPEAKTLLDALHRTGYQSVKDIKIGRFFDITIEGDLKTVEEIADRFLANPVVETFEVSEL